MYQYICLFYLWLTSSMTLISRPTAGSTQTKNIALLCVGLCCCIIQNQIKVDEVEKRNFGDSCNFYQSLIWKLKYCHQDLAYVILQILFILLYWLFPQFIKKTCICSHKFLKKKPELVPITSNNSEACMALTCIGSSAQIKASLCCCWKNIKQCCSQLSIFYWN